jgi:HEPN domain-containing protein
MARTFTTADGLIPVDLLHSGLDHFSAATELFRSSPSFLDSAGYLAHISVELLLKSWLLHSAGQFAGIHALRDLYDELAKSHGAVPLSEEEARILALLDEYAQLRYPNRNSPTEVGTEDLPAIEALIEAILGRLPKELREALDKVSPVQKGGRVLMKKKIEPTGKDT